MIALLLAACGGGSSGGAPDAAPTPDSAPAPDAAPACAPTAACTAIASPTCLAIADNTGLGTQRLRMTHLSISSPAAFGSGIVAQIIGGATEPSLAACNLNGTATFNWLLELDGATSLQFGGAKPVADPTTTPYTFTNEVVDGHPVMPVTTTVAIDGSGNLTSVAADAVIPVYLDSQATQVLLLPLSQVVFDGTLSSDHNCIGSYNAAGLDPNSSCAPDSTHPAFLDGGHVSGFISLENADGVTISQLNESLCVLLSGDSATYGDGGNPDRCKRDNGGNILFQGNWCSTTNSAGGCADSMKFQGTFAASAVTTP